MKVSLSQISDYQIIEVLGQGGMGKVYKAFDSKLKRTIALKTILPGKATAKAISRFHKEAVAISKLHHPCIVKIYMVGEEQGVHFFTMDYIEGMPLDKYVKNNRISMKKIAILMNKIAKGVEYAHSKGIVHRDLKPANILVDKDGNPHIMDFGIAKMDTSEYELTKTGEVLGTIFYMSPEQVKGFHAEVDAQSDVFSLGAIFYKILTGKYAFHGETLMELFHKIIYEEPIAPTKIKKRIPKVLEKICLKALAKDKKQRYPSAKKFADDLGNFTKNREVNVKPVRSVHQYKYVLIVIPVVVLMIFLFFKSDSSSEQISFEKISNSISAEKSLYIKANDYIFQKDYDKALEIFKQLLIKPNDVLQGEIITRIIFILAEQQNNSDAIEYFNMLKEPSDEALLTMAKVYENMENPRGAIELLNKVIFLQKNTVSIAKSLYFKGCILYKDKDYENSLVNFEGALENLEKASMQPYYYTSLLLHTGKSLFHLKKIDKAIAVLEKITSPTQRTSEFYKYLGMCYYSHQNYVRASEYFNEAMKLEPQHDSNYVWLAKIEEREGNYAKAKTLISKALSLNIVNEEAVSTLLSIALKEPDIENKYFWMIAHYVGQLARAQRPNTFVLEIQELYKKYSIYYNQWLTVKNPAARPDIFINTLSKSTNYDLYNNAIQGIISLRYHPETKTLLEELLATKEKSEQIHKNIERIIFILQKQIENEQKNVLFYFLIDFYLNENFSSLISLEIDKEKVITVLKNKSCSTYFRYFAAHALANMGEFEILERISNEKDMIASLTCKCVLRNMGHFTTIADSFSLKNISDEFLLVNVVRSMNFPLQFHIKSANEEQQKRVEYLQDFLNHNNDRVRLYAAGNLGVVKSLQKDKILLKKIRNILFSYTNHSNPYIRNCAHYYFWRTISWQEFPQYRSLYVKTLFENNNQITQTLLFFSFAFDMKQVENELVRLIKETSDVTIRILAIYALCVANAQHPYLEQILFDNNETFFIRASTGISSNYQRLLDLFYAKNALEKFQKNIETVREQMEKIALQKSEKLKIFMYMFNNFLFGETPLKFFEQEESMEVKAHIIMNTCGGYKIPMLAFLSLGGTSSQQKKELMAKYRNAPHEKLQQMIAASYIVSSSPSIRESVFLKYLKSGSTNQKLGTAKGFYCLVFFKIINKLSLNIVLDRELPNRKYNNYIDKLRLLSEEWKSIEQWLTYAVKLAPEAKYFYERAIIKRESGREHEALLDLEQALKLEPDNIYCQIEIADLLVDVNQVEIASEYLNSLTKQFLDYEEWEKIGLIYWKLKDIPNARKYLFKSVGNNKEAYHIWASLHTIDANIWIARTYAYEEDYDKAIHYLRYYDSIEKRIYSTSRKNIVPLRLRRIRKIPEFQNILHHPWIQKLPK